MRRQLSVTMAALVASPLVVLGHEGHSTATRADFVSGASHVIGVYTPQPKDHSPAAVVEAANAFLAALTDAQRSAVLLPLDSPERQNWTNIPQRENGGLALGECNVRQLESFCDLLATLLSEQGYAKVCHVMLADDQLLSGGRPRGGFGAEEFYVAVFGAPSETAPWGLQIDGHHLGVNVWVEGEEVGLAPSFIGTQPQAFQIADKPYRPLADENDLAFRLVQSLTDSQRDEAVLAAQRGRLATGPGENGVPAPEGLVCAGFTHAQRELLLALVGKWVNDLPPRQAALRMQRITADLDQTRFSWRGGLDNGAAISYRIQGPSLIIEYGAQDAGADHIHTMYSDPTNPYGGQVNLIEQPRRRGPRGPRPPRR